MNSYQKLATLCDDLTDFFLGQEPASYIGKESDSKPTITISEDGRHVRVVWDAWEWVDGDTRYDMVMEAYLQAFGKEKALTVHSAVGNTTKEELFIRKYKS